MTGVARHLVYRNLIYSIMTPRYLSLYRSQITSCTTECNAEMMRARAQNNNGKCNNNKMSGRVKGISLFERGLKRIIRAFIEIYVCSFRQLRRNREISTLDQLFHGDDSNARRSLHDFVKRPSESARARDNENKTKIHLAG